MIEWHVIVIAAAVCVDFVYSLWDGWSSPIPSLDFYRPETESCSTAALAARLSASAMTRALGMDRPDSTSNRGGVRELHLEFVTDRNFRK
jgi:hypothetical protein